MLICEMTSRFKMSNQGLLIHYLLVVASVRIYTYNILNIIIQMYLQIVQKVMICGILSRFSPIISYLLRPHQDTYLR